MDNMELRDWFAGFALIGLMHRYTEFGWDIDPAQLARQAYSIADAMIGGEPNP